MNQILPARIDRHLTLGTRLLFFFLLLLAPAQFSAQQPQPADPARLTIDSIFTYRTRSLGPVQWQQDGTGYLALEPCPTKKGFLDIVRYDALSGDRRIKLSAEKLTPPSAAEPLLVENFDLSADGQKLLVFTKSERVWRSNTRGDYWVVDLKDTSLRKLGGAAARPSSLMFAKFSPDAMRVGYVRENNVHYQGTEALIDKLVAANKQFSVMPYPNRSHGIYEGPGTTRHLFGLLTSYLNERLPAGGR